MIIRMWKRTRLIIFGVTIIFTLIKVASSDDPPALVDEDTVGIGELSDEYEERAFFDGTDQNEGVSEVYADIKGHQVPISCSTARNSPGECRPFLECYPFFNLHDGDSTAKTEKVDAVDDEKENPVNDELQNLYKRISGECPEDTLMKITTAMGSSIEKQNYICCPSMHNYTRVNRPLSRPPVSPDAATGYQNQPCGRYLREKRYLKNNSSRLNEHVGPSPAETKIVNGRPANRGEFPWAVALMLNNRQFCGGSLIDAQHVLTAAHCVYFMNRNDVNRLRVQIGDHNIYSTNDGHHENRGASNVYYHRSFSMKTLYDDVSVIRLSAPVRFSRNIQPICLSTNTWNLDNSMASVAGWGQMSERGPQSSVLRTVNVRVWNQNDCRRKYRGRAPGGISNGMICAGGSGSDSCKGDSGGPLSINRGGSVSQIGVVSWGIGCGTFPGVYARVDQYLQWINKNRR